MRAALHMANLFPAQDFDFEMVEVRTLIADDSISLIQPNSFVILLHGEQPNLRRKQYKRLHAGDFIRAEAGSVDHRFWGETGCTCVLLTSTRDVIL